MTRYYAYLINEQGCNFDKDEFTSIGDVRKWAAKRGGDYICKVYDLGDRINTYTDHPIYEWQYVNGRKRRE